MIYRLSVIFLFTFFISPGFVCSAPPSLKIYAWVNYMPPELLEEFTRETGIPVVASFFADNNALLRKLSEERELERFDLVTPSAETVQRLVAEELLLPLRHEDIPNLRFLDPWFAKLAYDKGFTHSTPFFWGAIGIVIDKRVVPEELAATIFGYNDVWNAQYDGKLLLPNDFRSVLSVMLLSRGYPVNDQNPDHLEAAMQVLERVAPAAYNFNTVDQVEDMAKLSVAIGIVWSNEAFSRSDPSSFFQFIFPKEGSPMWIDTLAIPANAPNPEAAHAFINFMLRPKNLAKVSKNLGHAVPAPAAVALLPKALQQNTIVYPPEQLRDRFEPELMLPPAIMDSLEKRWARLKDKTTAATP